MSHWHCMLLYWYLVTWWWSQLSINLQNLHAFTIYRLNLCLKLISHHWWAWNGGGEALSNGQILWNWITNYNYHLLCLSAGPIGYIYVYGSNNLQRLRRILCLPFRNEVVAGINNNIIWTKNSNCSHSLNELNESKTQSSAVSLFFTQAADFAIGDNRQLLVWNIFKI